MSAEWFDGKYGEWRKEVLTEKMNSRMKVPKAEEKDIAKHYREEHKKMVEAKKNGETYEFVSYQ